MHCPGCRGGDKVPAKGYFLCPICDAEWHEEEEEDQQPDDLVERLRETLVLAEEKTPDIWIDGTLHEGSVMQTTMQRNPDGHEASDRIEELEARLAKAEAERDAIEAEMKRRNDNERRNCINWGPCSEHDEQGNRP